MLFVWSIEAVLLAFMLLGVNDFLPVGALVAIEQVTLAAFALLSHVVVLALAQDAHTPVACCYLSALLVHVVSSTSLETSAEAIALSSFAAVQVFVAVAAVFASTKGATALCFDRLALMLLLFGARVLWPVKIAFGVLACASAIAGIWDRRVSIFANIALCVAFFACAGILGGNAFTLGWAAAVLVAAAAWALQRTPEPEYEAVQSAARFQWPEVTFKKGV